MKQNKDFNLDEFLGFYDLYTKEVSKVIIGNTDVVKGILICLLSKGHVLLEGIPGIGKTKLSIKEILPIDLIDFISINKSVFQVS